MDKEKDQKLIKIPYQLTVRELADRLGENVTIVIKKLMDNGFIANLNETIDYETAVIISQELGHETELDEDVGDEVVTLEKLNEILS